MIKGLLILGIVAILLSGCIAIDVTEVISTDGQSAVNIKYDMRELLELTFDMEGAEQTDFCEEFLAEPKRIMNPTCQNDNGLISITGTVQHDDQAFMSSSQGGFTEYTYYLSRGMAFLDEHNEEAEQGFLGNEMMESMGVTFEYTVEMPGELVSTSHGSIEENRVIVNILEVDEGDDVIIISREESSGVIGTTIGMEAILLGVGLIVLLGVIVLFVKKRKG